jgi:hypothetical protein
MATGQQARVWADYSQYWVAAGPDIEVGDDLAPGLLADLGSQAVAVITGLRYGNVKVTAQAVPTPPAGMDPGGDVVAETDLECPEGTIAVCDWAGGGHDELGELAIAGTGRYRLRVHARGHDQVSEGRSKEEHYLLIWPVAEPAPPPLLTPMDAYGRTFNGEDDPEAPPLDALDLAAATAVRWLADLVNQSNPPDLSGELTVVHAETIAAATRAGGLRSRVVTSDRSDRRLFFEPLRIPVTISGSCARDAPESSFGRAEYVTRRPRLVLRQRSADTAATGRLT